MDGPLSAAEVHVERTFSLQKRVKNYQFSKMMQEWLSSLAALGTKSDMARKLDFSIGLGLSLQLGLYTISLTESQVFIDFLGIISSVTIL